MNKYKIGDRVKLVVFGDADEPLCKSDEGKTGTIVGINAPDGEEYCYQVLLDTSTYGDDGYYCEELKLLINKTKKLAEQMLA